MAVLGQAAPEGRLRRSSSQGRLSNRASHTNLASLSNLAKLWRVKMNRVTMTSNQKMLRLKSPPLKRSPMLTGRSRSTFQARAEAAAPTTTGDRNLKQWAHRPLKPLLSTACPSCRNQMLVTYIDADPWYRQGEVAWLISWLATKTRETLTWDHRW